MPFNRYTPRVSWGLGSGLNHFPVLFMPFLLYIQVKEPLSGVIAAVAFRHA